MESSLKKNMKEKSRMKSKNDYLNEKVYEMSEKIQELEIELKEAKNKELVQPIKEVVKVVKVVEVVENSENMFMNILLVILTFMFLKMINGMNLNMDLVIYNVLTMHISVLVIYYYYKSSKQEIIM